MKLCIIRLLTEVRR